jgi:oxygen-independent coproporphyrinogen-3 oxidase
MDRITKSKDGIFTLSNGAEITIEMDPGTFDLHYINAVKEMGFNRISLGVQSFDDNVLAIMGRVHRSLDIYSSIDMIRQVYGDHANYSIDLISGVPGLTLAGWAETLYKAERLRPRPMHMSLYDLQLEKGTTFGKWYTNSEQNMNDSYENDPRNNKHHPALPSAEDCAFMYSYASGYLKSKKYDHYEISSYAYTTLHDRKAHRSQHNQIYWEYGGQWYAAGMGSTSNINGVRFARPRAFSDYILWTEGLKQDQSDVTNMKVPPWMYTDIHVKLEDSNDDLILDIIMTRLRTSEGLDLDWVAKHDNYGKTHVDAILRGFILALDLGLGYRINSRCVTHGSIKLSDPKGFLFSNTIISNIFLSLSELSAIASNDAHS